jgi:3-demethylubiquinone-9 3-methyltransferase
MTGEAFTVCSRAGTEGESAASVYAGTFKDSKPGRADRHPKARPEPAGAVMAADFGLMGHKFAALTAGRSSRSIRPSRSRSRARNRPRRITAGPGPSGGGPEVACGWRRTRTACHGKSSLACSST